MSAKNIRNFVIISHIDHGKSTLADRFLELTNTVPAQEMQEQFLDQMGLEKEKGITIKMHPVSMDWSYQGKEYLLNLIDTPGHVDFSYEVSRALAAVEGAILLVDATQGIQAQTIRNLELARDQNLEIIPAVNKIDLDRAQTKKSKQEIAALLDIDPEEVLAVSAKEGRGVEKLLAEVVERIPAPSSAEEDFQGLIFDSQYDSFQGVVVFLRVMQGEIEEGDAICIKPHEVAGEVKELGHFRPQREATPMLKTGEIGYIITGIKEADKVQVGQTITRADSDAKTLAGYKEVKPVVFNGLYVRQDQDFEVLKNSLRKLKLNDPALSFELQKKKGLGRGVQVGFLGLLHAEIVIRRLEEEFGLDLVVTAPSVNYRVKTDQWQTVNSAVDWPAWSEIEEIKEPWAQLQILVDKNHFGAAMEILENLHGKLKDQSFLEQKFRLIYEAPFREIISGFDDQLKSATHGRASYDFELIGYQEADLVQLRVLVAGEEKSSLAQVVAREQARAKAQKMAQKLHRLLPPQQFRVPIQITKEGDIVARRTLKAKRKDVTASLYGGDYSRKKKLLSQQRERKKEMAEQGQVDIPPAVLLKIWKN